MQVLLYDGYKKGYDIFRFDLLYENLFSLYIYF